MANLEKKDQKRIDAHEKNIENSKQKIWKYEQKIIKNDLDNDKKEKLQEKINEELHFIELQENIIDNTKVAAQSE